MGGRGTRQARAHLYLRHMHQFPLEKSYGAVISYIRRLQDDWRNVWPIYAYLNSDKPEWNSISTSMEPVGEEET